MKLAALFGPFAASRGSCASLDWPLVAAAYPGATLERCTNDAVPTPIAASPSAGSYWIHGQQGTGVSLETDDFSVANIAPKPPLGEKVAVIVETRIQDNLIPLVLHFSSVLGPSWHLILYTMEANWTMPASAPFRRAVKEGRISVGFIPADTLFLNWVYVSVFLTRPFLWEQLQSANRILLFQMDSIICSNSNQTVDDFLEWDFIGAPLGHGKARGYNGGLSVRNPKLMLDIINTNNFDEDAMKGEVAMSIEDQWFYRKMTELGYPKLPPDDVAMRFSVETIWYDAPLGFHKPRYWQKDRMDDIRKYCPEVEMVS
ncbi:hypothetical protein GQ53DRAFT_793840 [Thozetella sp. PMI_491]|nr:hypothetical protein GQ53DRAFT_793840 [Thozetella sp. PMI_491]